MEKRFVIIFFTPKTINRFLVATFIVAIFSQVVLADDKTAVKNILKERFDNIIAVVKNKELDEKTKKVRIEDIIKPIFDLPLMSRLSLGRETWMAMTKEEQKKFFELFTKMLKLAYLSKIPSYFDEEIIIEEPNQVNQKKIYIPTIIVSKDKKTSVLYKFYRSDTGWKIYDIEAKSISCIQSFRSQFTECLQEGTVKELMVEMEKKVSS